MTETTTHHIRREVKTWFRGDGHRDFSVTSYHFQIAVRGIAPQKPDGGYEPWEIREQQLKLDQNPERSKSGWSPWLNLYLHHVGELAALFAAMEELLAGGPDQEDRIEESA